MLSVYEWYLKDGNPSASRDFVSTAWMKTARGVSKYLFYWLSGGTSLSFEEEKALCNRGRGILSYFADTLQSLDWGSVGNDLSTNDREAGRFVHFSYSIQILIAPLISLRSRPDRKFDIISPEAISALESVWQAVKRIHPNADLEITRHRLKRPLAVARDTLDNDFVSLKGPVVPESPQESILPEVRYWNHFIPGLRR